MLMLVHLKAGHVEDYEQLRKVAKKAVRGGDVLFLPALNFLFLLGRVDYLPKTDAIEYTGPVDEAV
jgi:hypothetical protein